MMDAPEPETAHAPSPETEAKLRRLQEGLGELDSLLVAYSGGVDSAFLAATAHRILGERMVAVLADSPSLARRERQEALEFAQAQGFSVEVVLTEELDQPEYSRNDANRCYHCKTELFRQIRLLGARRGFERIAFGMNADDRGDYRPGQRAARELQVIAPLAEVGLSKPEIRQLARAAGYALWDRPASPCLASRLAYGEPVTRQALAQIEAGEEILRRHGFREFRLRRHGELARIEIARPELGRALSLELLDELSAALKALGFKFVALDCAGFRSGSLNAVLPAETLARHGG